MAGGSSAMPRPAMAALRSACAVLPLKRPPTCTSSSFPPGPVRRQVVRPLGWAGVTQSWSDSSHSVAGVPRAAR
ncbi:hypothetical protein D3C87_1032400 [compost metagenome]